jgi:hypothetical protein
MLALAIERVLVRPASRKGLAKRNTLLNRGKYKKKTENGRKKPK